MRLILLNNYVVSLITTQLKLTANDWKKIFFRYVRLLWNNF
jgi:hypothetical protein